MEKQENFPVSAYRFAQVVAEVYSKYTGQTWVVAKKEKEPCIQEPYKK